MERLYDGRFPRFRNDSGSESFTHPSSVVVGLWICLNGLSPGALAEYTHVSALPLILVTLYQTVHTSSPLEDDIMASLMPKLHLVQFPT